MTKPPGGLALAKLFCGALVEKKAAELRVLDVRELSSITDYLIVATATSEPHLRALRVELEKALDSQNVHIVGTEAPQGSGWVVVDTFDVMTHLFLAEQRTKYRLESLWKDAEEIDVDKLLSTKVLPARAKAARKVKPPVRSRARKR